MIIQTWNKQIYEKNIVEQRAQLGDVYFNIIRGWCIAIGYGWDKNSFEGKRILSENFSSKFGNEAKYLYISIMRKENTDFRRELFLLEDLALSKFLPAIFRLGLYYEFGIENLLHSDENRAKQYYLQAARLGHLQAKRRMISYKLEKLPCFKRQLNYFCRFPLAVHAAIIASRNSGDYRINF